MINNYVVCVEADRELNYLYKILMVFTRRRVETININAYRLDALSVSRFNIKFRSDERMARNLSKQLNRQVDILKADVYLWEAIDIDELGVYAISKKDVRDISTVRKVVDANGATMRERENIYLIEKVAARAELEAFRQQLAPFQLLDFGYSGFAGVLNAKIQKEVYI